MYLRIKSSTISLKEIILVCVCLCVSGVRVCVVPLCALWDLLVQKHKPLFGSVCFFEGPKGSTRSHVASRVRVVMSWIDTRLRLQSARRESTEWSCVNEMLCAWCAWKWLGWTRRLHSFYPLQWPPLLNELVHTDFAKLYFSCILNILVSRRKHFIMLQPLWYRLSAFVPCKTFTNWKKGSLAKKKKKKKKQQPLD